MRRLVCTLALAASCKSSNAPSVAPVAVRSDADSALLVPHLYSPGQYGYVTRDGNPAFPGRFALARRFHEGRAAVSTGKDKWGFVNADGVLVVSARYDLVGDYHDGKARVFHLSPPEEGPLGFHGQGELTEATLDRDGNEAGERKRAAPVIPDLATGPRPMFEEFTMVPTSPPRWETFSGQGGKLGLRELATKREIFPAAHSDIRLIEDIDGSGVKFLATRSPYDTPPPGPMWTVHDLDGKPIVAAAFDVGAYSSEGYFTAAFLGNGTDATWTAIDGAGHKAVAIPYASRAFVFRGGIAEVWVADVDPIFVSHDRIFAEMAPIDARHRAAGRATVAP